VDGICHVTRFYHKGKNGIFTQTFIMAKIKENDRPKSGIYSHFGKPNGKPFVYAAILCVIILIMTVIFNPGRLAKKMAQNQVYTTAPVSTDPEFTRQGELVFLKSDSTSLAKIDIEIADTDPLRERGLMFRRHMGMNHGMLFIFEDEDVRSFWMKNTYIPLDIVYLNAQKKIVSIHENAATLNEQSIPSGFPAKYVVEVNAGFCALHSIQVGDGMSFLRK